MGSMQFADWAEREILFGDPVVTEIESRVTTADYDVRLNHLNWPGGGALRLASSRSWLDIMLTGRPMWRLDTERGAAGGIVDGAALLVAAGTPIVVDWQESDIRSITCLFDPAAMLSRAGLTGDWRWAEGQPADELFIRRMRGVTGLLVEEMLHPGLAADIRIDSLLTYLACGLQEAAGGSVVPELPRAALDDRQLRIIAELVQDVTAPLPSVQTLSDALQIGSAALGRMFRNRTGGTLRRYLAEQRIVRARRLLCDRPLLIKQVAAASGFQSTAAFVAAFRTSLGTTPAAYRAGVMPRQMQRRAAPCRRSASSGPSTGAGSSAPISATTSAPASIQPLDSSADSAGCTSPNP